MLRRYLACLKYAGGDFWLRTGLAEYPCSFSRQAKCIFTTPLLAKKVLRRIDAPGDYRSTAQQKSHTESGRIQWQQHPPQPPARRQGSVFSSQFDDAQFHDNATGKPHSRSSPYALHDDPDFKLGARLRSHDPEQGLGFGPLPRNQQMTDTRHGSRSQSESWFEEGFGSGEKFRGSSAVYDGELREDDEEEEEEEEGEEEDEGEGMDDVTYRAWKHKEALRNIKRGYASDGEGEESDDEEEEEGEAHRDNNADRQLTHTIASAPSLTALISLFKQHEATLNNMHLSTFCNQAVLRGSVSDVENTRQLLGKCTVKLAHMYPKGDAPVKLVGDLVWAYGRLRGRPPKEFESLFLQPLSQSPQILQNATSIDVAKLAVALARMPDRNEQLVRALVTAANYKVTKCPPRRLANMMWAFTSMGVEHPGFFQAAMVHAGKHLQDFDAENLANVMRSLSRNKLYDPKLYSDAADIVRRSIMDFRPKQLATALSAFAFAGHKNDRMLVAACKAIRKSIQSMGPDTLSSVILSLARLGHQDEVLYNIMCAELSQHVQYMTPTNVTAVFSACGAQRHVHEGLFGELGKVVAERMREFTGVQMLMILNALSQLRFSHSKTMAPIITALSSDNQKCDEYTLDHWSSVLNYTAALGQYNTVLLKHASVRLVPELCRDVEKWVEAQQSMEEDGVDVSPQGYPHSRLYDPHYLQRVFTIFSSLVEHRHTETSLLEACLDVLCCGAGVLGPWNTVKILRALTDAFVMLPKAKDAQAIAFFDRCVWLVAQRAAKASASELTQALHFAACHPHLVSPFTFNDIIKAINMHEPSEFPPQDQLLLMQTMRALEARAAIKAQHAQHIATSTAREPAIADTAQQEPHSQSDDPPPKLQRERRKLPNLLPLHFLLLTRFIGPVLEQQNKLQSALPFSQIQHQISETLNAMGVKSTVNSPVGRSLLIGDVIVDSCSFFPSSSQSMEQVSMSSSLPQTRLAPAPDSNKLPTSLHSVSSSRVSSETQQSQAPLVFEIHEEKAYTRTDAYRLLPSAEFKNSSLRAHGCGVVNVPEAAWQLLESEQDKVLYLRGKLLAASWQLSRTSTPTQNV